MLKLLRHQERFPVVFARDETGNGKFMSSGIGNGKFGKIEPFGSMGVLEWVGVVGLLPASGKSDVGL